MIQMKVLSLAGMLTFCGYAYADNPDGDLMTGLTIDHTVSRFGHEFYRYLADHRRTYYPNAKENLTIKERPSARWGSIIWVESYSTQVYYNRIGAGGNDIKAIAEAASIHINRRVKATGNRKAVSKK